MTSFFRLNSPWAIDLSTNLKLFTETFMTKKHFRRACTMMRDSPIRIGLSVKTMRSARMLSSGLRQKHTKKSLEIGSKLSIVILLKFQMVKYFCKSLTSTLDIKKCQMETLRRKYRTIWQRNSLQ